MGKAPELGTRVPSISRHALQREVSFGPSACPCVDHGWLGSRRFDLLTELGTRVPGVSEHALERPKVLHPTQSMPWSAQRCCSQPKADRGIQAFGMCVPPMLAR